MNDRVVLNQRQMIYWRLLGAASGLAEAGATLEAMARDLADRLELPSEILDPSIGVDVLLHRYPKLVPHFDAVARCVQQVEEAAAGVAHVGSGAVAVETAAIPD